MDRLDLRVVSLISREDMVECPILAGRQYAVRINAADVKFGREQLRFWIFCTLKLPARVISSYRRLGDAVVVAAESAGGRGAAIRLSDPFKRRPPMDGANLKDTARASADGPTLTNWVSGELQLAPPKGETLANRIFLTAMLETYVSNTLVIDLEKESITSHLGGKLAPVELPDL